MISQRNINTLRTPNPASTGMFAFAMRNAHSNGAGMNASMKRSLTTINRVCGYGFVSGSHALPTRMFDAGAPNE